MMTNAIIIYLLQIFCSISILPCNSLKLSNEKREGVDRIRERDFRKCGQGVCECLGSGIFLQHGGCLKLSGN